MWVRAFESRMMMVAGKVTGLMKALETQGRWKTGILQVRSTKKHKLLLRSHRTITY